jgi:hypothetical protein
VIFFEKKKTSGQMVTSSDHDHIYNALKKYVPKRQLSYDNVSDIVSYYADVKKRGRAELNAILANLGLQFSPSLRTELVICQVLATAITFNYEACCRVAASAMPSVQDKTHLEFVHQMMVLLEFVAPAQHKTFLIDLATRLSEPDPRKKYVSGGGKPSEGTRFRHAIFTKLTGLASQPKPKAKAKFSQPKQPRQPRQPLQKKPRGPQVPPQDVQLLCRTRELAKTVKARSVEAALPVEEGHSNDTCGYSSSQPVLDDLYIYFNPDSPIVPASQSTPWIDVWGVPSSAADMSGHGYDVSAEAIEQLAMDMSAADVSADEAYVLSDDFVINLSLFD